MTDQTGATPALTIDYATQRSGLRPMSVLAGRWVLGLSVVPAVVGLGILSTYRLTGNEDLPGLGFLWLMAGGASTFVLGVIALVNWIRALSRRPRERRVTRLYATAIVVCVITIPVAMVCAQVGSAWMESPHFRVRVRNATAVPLDHVAVHFDSRDVDVYSLGPGQTTTTGLVWATHKGMVKITVWANGQRRTKDDRQFGAWYGHGSKKNWQPFEVVVEPAELPKATP